MQVREKTHHIDIDNAEINASDSERIRWDETDTAADIRARKTPGKLLRAYRERAGLTLVELAAAVGTKYPNISAIENDRRALGLDMARKLGTVLSVDYRTFLDRSTESD